MSRRRIQPRGAGARGESRSTSSPTQPAVAASVTPNAEQHSVASDASSGSRSAPVSTASSFSMPRILDSAQLYQAYCGLQQEVSALKAQNTALKAELADMKLERRHSANDSDSSSTDMSSDVKKWGRYFSLFFNTFVTVSTFASTLPEVLFASDSATQYLTDANEAIGPTVELYEQIPLKYHPIMKLAAQSKGKKFVKLFRDAISASRSTSISQLRNNSGPIIFNLPSAYFESDFSPKRIAVPEIRALLGYNADFADSEEGKKFPEKAYDRFPPVLCKDDDSSKVENRFRNEKLFMVARAIIFGKKAAKAKSLAVGREPSFYLRSDMPAATTFGLIALISGIARFTLSPDTRFDNGGIGPETGIDYSGDINYYKKYLTVLRDDPSTASYVNRLLKEWDAEVFSMHNAAMKRSPDDVDREVIDMDNISSDEIERDMQRLRVAEAATNADQINHTMQDRECDTMANIRLTDLQPENSDFIPNLIAPGRAQSFSNPEHQLNSDRGSNFDIDDDRGSWADDDCIHTQEPAAEAEYINIPEKEIHATSSSRALDSPSISPLQPALNSAESSAMPVGLTAHSEPPRRSTRSDAIRTTKANVDTPGSSGLNPMLQAVDPANFHPLLMHSDSAAAVNHGNLEASAQEKAPPKRGTRMAARGRGKSGRK